MIEYKKEFGEKEKAVLLEISLQSEKYKASQQSQQLLFAIAGLLLLAAGLFVKTIAISIVGVVAVIFAVLLPKLHRIQLNNMYKKMDERVLSGTRQYKVDASGIEIQSYAGTSKYSWDAMDSCGQQGDYIWIKRVDNQVMLFDKTDLEKMKQEELLQLCKTNIKA